MSKQQTVPTKKIILWIVLIAVLVGIVFIATANLFHWDLAGLVSSPKKTVVTEIIRSPREKVTTTEEGKTLWDLLQLLGVLAIPIVVGFGTAFFTRQQTKTSEANAETQQQEVFLRAYFDKLSDLLLDKELSTNPNIQSIVKARTLAALHILSTKRKAIVLRFLDDSALLKYVKSFLYSLDLSHTDLIRIDLSGAKLWLTNLSGADLSDANLSKADLRNANLSGAKLSFANLSGADLLDTNLFGANLFGADLSAAYLLDTNLSGANLSAASITTKQLKRATNVTSEQFAQIRPPEPVATQEATTAQTSTTPDLSERKPDQTDQEEAEQQEHKQPKQDTDAAH